MKREIRALFKNVLIEEKGKKITITAKKEQTLELLRFLKNKGYNYLVLISAVDWIKEKEFELIYVLSSYVRKEKLHVILKTRIPRENPRFKTVIPIFENAEPYEREIHELFGIKFEGHPRLTPLLLERDYRIPPFRKDFDTRKYVKKFFEEIPSIEP